MTALETALVVWTAAYQLLSFVYMALACEHYLRTNHARLFADRKNK